MNPRISPKVLWIAAGVALIVASLVGALVGALVVARLGTGVPRVDSPAPGSPASPPAHVALQTVPAAGPTPGMPVQAGTISPVAPSTPSRMPAPPVAQPSNEIPVPAEVPGATARPRPPGMPDPSLFKPLPVVKLDSADMNQRYEALRKARLQRDGEALASMLKDPLLAQSAAEALMDLDLMGGTAREPVLDAVDDGDLPVHIRAAILQEVVLRDEGSRESLIRKARESRDPEFRRMAVGFTSRYNKVSEAIPGLMSFLRDSDALVRQMAAGELMRLTGETGPGEDVAAWEAWWNSHGSRVFQRAAN